MAIKLETVVSIEWFTIMKGIPLLRKFAQVTTQDQDSRMVCKLSCAHTFVTCIV